MSPAPLLLRLLLAFALLGNVLQGNGWVSPASAMSPSTAEQAGDCHGSTPEPSPPVSPDAHAMPCCDDAAGSVFGCACDCLQSSAMVVAGFEFVGSHAGHAETARRPPANASDGPASNLLRPPIPRA